MEVVFLMFPGVLVSGVCVCVCVCSSSSIMSVVYTDCCRNVESLFMGLLYS